MGSFPEAVTWLGISGLLLTGIPVTSGTYEHTCEANAGPRQGFCGERLPEALAMTCQFYNKRSGLVDTSQHRKAREVFLPQDEAVAVLSKRSRQGIICECCVNRCTMHELSSYCAAVDDVKRGGSQVPLGLETQLTRLHSADDQKPRETSKPDAGSERNSEEPTKSVPLNEKEMSRQASTSVTPEQTKGTVATSKEFVPEANDSGLRSRLRALLMP